MKRYIASILVVAIGVGLGAQRSAAQSTATQILTTAVPFQLIAPDARASGMGDVGTGIADNSNAIYWNPAGLAFQSGKEVYLTHSQWLPQFNSDLFYEYANFKWNDEETFGGTIAANITFLNLGKFIYTTEQSPDPLGEFHSFEYSVALGYATKLSNEWGFGGNIRYIQSSLSPLTVGQEKQKGVGRSVSFDISAMWRPDSTYIEELANRLAVGVNIANIGPKVRYVDVAQADPLPTVLRLGASYKVLKDEYNEITLAADVAKLLVHRDSTGLSDNLPKAFVTAWDANTGKSFMLSLGAEYWYDQLLALRAGYYTEGAMIGGRRYLTFGAGLRYDVYQFDFSYINTFEQNHPLANTLRFSLGITW
ncbi:MAG: type IX secretion system outer membrane channel protein PorV [Bacteroidetes bacterium]|nr:type IX secretion system outer membrane channel protein PorV [Bacteroidota bacterium]